jgi:protein SCO1/2
MDDAVTFAEYKPAWPLAHFTTASAEIFRTLGWLGEHARPVLGQLDAMLGDANAPFPGAARVQLEKVVTALRASPPARAQGGSCCGGATPLQLLRTPANPSWPSATSVDVELEDQDGNTLHYDDVFGGKPTIAVFFYTRCPNPNKCSLTVTRLGQLQQAIAAEGLTTQLRTVAITYDPDFDVPARLRAYGADRGVLFAADHRLIRATRGFARLQERFELGVNFVGPTVNTHRIELFILDRDGDVAVTFARVQWEVGEVLARARDLVAGARR